RTARAPARRFRGPRDAGEHPHRKRAGRDGPQVDLPAPARVWASRALRVVWMADRGSRGPALLYLWRTSARAAADGHPFCGSPGGNVRVVIAHARGAARNATHDRRRIGNRVTKLGRHPVPVMIRKREGSSTFRPTVTSEDAALVIRASTE